MKGFCCSLAFQFKLRLTLSMYSVLDEMTVGKGNGLAWMVT